MSNHAHLWHGSDNNYGEITELNEDLIHIVLSIMFAELSNLYIGEDDLGPLESDAEQGTKVCVEDPSDLFWCNAFSFADVILTLFENNSDDSIMLAFRLAGIQFTGQQKRSQSWAYLAAGIVRVLEERIRGDGTALYKATERNPYSRRTVPHRLWETIDDGTYWTQAILMGADSFVLNQMVHSGFLVARHRPETLTEQGAGKRTPQVRSRLRRPHAPPP